jgi:hypothetical protein
MELIIHKHLNLEPKNCYYQLQYTVPIWEIELKGSILDSDYFSTSLKDITRYKNIAYSEELKRSLFQPYPDDPNFELIGFDKKNEILDLVSSTDGFKRKFLKPLSSYKQYCYQSSSIILDHPNFEMGIHLDNHSIIIQMIVNLLHDNETSTEFYTVDSIQPVYQAPKLKNHGVLFVNTPGALHAIRNITKPRWIWYSCINLINL